MASSKRASHSEIGEKLKDRICSIPDLPVEQLIANAECRFESCSIIEIVNILGRYMGWEPREDWTDSGKSQFDEGETKLLEKVVQYMPSRTFIVLPLFIVGSNNELVPQLVIRTFHPTAFVDLERRTYRTFEEFRCHNRFNSGTLYYPAGGEVQYNPTTGRLLVNKCPINRQSVLLNATMLAGMALAPVPIVGAPILFASCALGLVTSGQKLVSAYKRKQASKVQEWTSMAANVVVSAAATTKAISMALRVKPPALNFFTKFIGGGITCGFAVYTGITTVNWKKLSKVEKIILTCEICTIFCVAISLTMGERLLRYCQDIAKGATNALNEPRQCLLPNNHSMMVNCGQFCFLYLKNFAIGKIKKNCGTDDLPMDMFMQVVMPLIKLYNGKQNLDYAALLLWLKNVTHLSESLKSVEVTLHGQQFKLSMLCRLFLYEVPGASAVTMLRGLAILEDENAIVTDVRHWIDNDPALFRWVAAHNPNDHTYNDLFRMLHCLQVMCRDRSIRVTNFEYGRQPTLILSNYIAINAELSPLKMKQLLTMTTGG